MRPSSVRQLANSMAIVTVALLETGCLGAYAYPTVACTPAVKVRAKCDEFHAFRVDIVEQTACICLDCHHSHVLTPVHKFFGDHLGPQVQLSVDYGWVLFGVLSHNRHIHSTMKVRIYRRGFQTVELDSWQLNRQVEWKPADGIEAQEKAVDDLVSAESTPDSWTLDRDESNDGANAKTTLARARALFGSLADARASKGHRESLLFAAMEYERLFDERAACAITRQRLQAKAMTLRERAGR